MIRAALVSLSMLVAVPAHADLTSAMMSRVGQGRPHGCPPRKWCQCGLNRVLASLGYRQTGSNRAIDTVHYGAHAGGFARNTIVVFPHHVGVATGKMCRPGSIQIVSANHSGRYGIGCYPKARVKATRKAVR